MKKHLFLTYLRILVAATLFAGGILGSVLAFVPSYDDFGNLIYTTLISKLTMFAVGISSALFAIFLAVPKLFRKK